MTSKVDAVRLAPDLRSWELFPSKAEDESVYLVGSLQADKYLVVPEKRYSLVMQIFEKLRLGQSPAQIEAGLQTQGLVVNVCEFCRMLAHKNLIEWEVAELSPGEPSNKQWGSLFGHLKALSWQVFNLSLGCFRPVLDGVASLALAILIIATLLTSLIVVWQMGINVQVLRETARQALRSRDVIWIILTSILILPIFVFLHESAHAVAAARGQVYPRQLSLRMYLLVAPYFSLQLPGLYTLPIGSRLLAIAAGPLMDLMLGNLFLLAGRRVGGVWAPWLTCVALSNYGRLIFNLLPIMPMTDGYAFLSQAAFREIDIRGRAGQEFQRWRQKKSNSFRGKYVAFFVLNVGMAAFIIVVALIQVNAIAVRWLKAVNLIPASGMAWWVVGGLIVLDGLCLYLARSRLRGLLGW